MTTAEELLLRRLLWLHHWHDDVMTLRGQDGEMFCTFCRLDFKRDSVTRIEAILTEHGMYEVAKRVNHQYGFPWTDPRTGSTHMPPTQATRGRFVDPFAAGEDLAMKFLIKQPCRDCPFRRDCTPFLRRARQIATQMQDDHFWFACHETTGVKGGRRIKPADQSHCAGLMKVLWRARSINVAMRMALAFKLITVDQLQARRPAVFRSLDAFVRHHERGN